jgi:hypothetical protein
MMEEQWHTGKKTKWTVLACTYRICVWWGLTTVWIIREFHKEEQENIIGGKGMKRLILIIMFLLLCPSLVLAAEETSFIQNEEDITTSESIAMDMFHYDLYEKYGEALRLWSFFAATGHNDLAEEVSNDVKSVFDDRFFSDLFYKHNEKYEYSTGDEEMLLLSVLSLNNIVKGYRLGTLDSLRMIFEENKDAADLVKDAAPRLYEKYLENKEKVKDQDHEN